MGEWLDRALLYTPVDYGFSATEKGYHKLLKQLKLPIESSPPFVMQGYGGATHFFTRSDRVIAIVCVAPDKRVTKTEIHWEGRHIKMRRSDKSARAYLNLRKRIKR